MRNLFLVVFTLVLLWHGNISWGNNNPLLPHPKGKHTRCGIIQNLDSLKKLNLPLQSLNSGKSPTGVYPSFPDLVYEVKIANIDNLSPIAFDYNQQVKRYIDIYTQERREQVSQMLGLAELYFPLFDEILDKHQLPLEFKYLAVVESALNPLAVSTSGAVGLWQFKINTGRMFDLKVNSYIDERMDPVKSTEAACMYLKYLYRIFNDWHLVMAAYNTGPGVVRNAIFRAGGETNFWKLYDHLPEAAQNYVPAFIAAAYAMQNAKAHQIEAMSPTALYMQTDTVHVSKPISFSVLAQEAGISLDILRFLNPTYRRGLVPKSDNGHSVRLPVSHIPRFLEKEQAIYNKTPRKLDFHDILARAGSTENKIKVEHKVQPGDYLHKIAVKYNCTIDDINIWNPRITGDLAIGQPVVVWVDEQTYVFLQQSPAGL